ncbi:hypothetical protein [Aneurinibacillus tyrosinisolvens]|uniref:hypothetical protein n=1 Tax=Aneurinibacillus tyrosinisolvens TaxID=1443435 RepID=UPI00063EEBF1|nr:hypothetical protein [Aneurinibacillus tyrosinisolvens]
MPYVNFVGKTENADRRDVYKYYLTVDREKVVNWDSKTRRKRLGNFKDRVIRGHRWKKGKMQVEEITKLYMNPGSTWLKRFSCTCEKTAYPCPVCAKNNHTFADFINNYQKIWAEMDETGINVEEEPQSDQAHRREMESLCDSLRDGTLPYPVILIHETNTEESAESGLPLGSPIVADGNHRLAATLMAKKASDTVTVYYGELEKAPG